MNKVHQQLQKVDPVRITELETASTHPVFRELFDDIVTDPIGHRPEVKAPDEAGIGDFETSLAKGHALQRDRRRPLVIATVGVAALLVTGIFALQSPDHASQPSSRATTTQAAAAKWRLVGDITSSWRTVSAIGYEPGVSLTCPTTTTCYADNFQQGASGTHLAIEVTNDGGVTWQPANLQLTLSGATSLACLDADTCATLGTDASGKAIFVETTDGGATWHSTAGPSELTSSIGVTVLACTTAESCVAIASDPAGQSGAALAFVTNDGGFTWSDANMPSGFVPGGLQCVSASDCIVSGFYQSPEGSSATPLGTALFSSDDGASWSTAAVPSGLGPLSSVSCADSADCTASFFGDDGSASEILTSTNGGKSWSAVTASGLSSAFVIGLSCPTASDCWAGGITGASDRSGGSGAIAVTVGDGSQGSVAATTDGGQSWQSPQLPQGISAVFAIACPSDTSCYALAIQAPSGGSQASFVLLAYGS